jgi:hypothetical protein
VAASLRMGTASEIVIRAYFDQMFGRTSLSSGAASLPQTFSAYGPTCATEMWPSSQA